MQTADILILVIIGLPALVGVIYGFLNIAFSILAWALALGISVKFSSNFAPLLENTIDSPELRALLAFIGLFIISLMILSGLGFLIVKLLGRTGLTAMDRILGLFFGMGLGVVIVLVVVFMAGFTAVPTEEWWQRSLILKPFERVSVWCERFIPESVAKYHSYKVTVPDETQNQALPVQQPDIVVKPET